MTFGIGLAAGLVARDEEEVRIRLDPNTPSQTVRVSYFIKGGFGGFGGSREGRKDFDLFLPTYQGDQRAQSIKAVVYAKGCEIAAFALDPLPPGPSQLWFDCRKLGTVWLKGVVTGHPHPSELTVGLVYVANWSPRFFGFSDGPAMSLPIAEIAPDRDGRFAVEVPDFANDGVTKSYQGQAYWSVMAWQAGSNDRYWLDADGEITGFPGALTIDRDYSKELQFRARHF
ncbi:MAG: hypothetical protein WBL61_13410 [Bryobacteraceae bacterium]